MGGTRVEGEVRSPPFAFRALLPTAGRQVLQRSGDLSGKRLVWTFELYFDSFGPGLGSEIAVAEVSPAAPTGKLIVGFKVAGNDGALEGFYRFDAEQPVPLARPALTPKVGEWIAMRIEYAPVAGSDQWTITVKDQPKGFMRNLSSASVAFGLGGVLSTPATSAAVRFDNVRIAITAP